MAAERKAESIPVPPVPAAPASTEPPAQAAPTPVDGASDNTGGPPPPPAVVLPEPAPGTITVARGLSVSCRRGIVDAGSVVMANDFADGDAGESHIRDLIARGALVKT